LNSGSNGWSAGGVLELSEPAPSKPLLHHEVSKERERPRVGHELRYRILGRQGASLLVEGKIDRRDRSFGRAVQDPIELDLRLCHQRTRRDHGLLVVRELRLPPVELARVCDAHLEAEPCQLQIFARELDVLPLDTFFGFRAKGRYIGCSRFEHHVENVYEVTVLTPLLAELARLEARPGLFRVNALVCPYESRRLTLRDESARRNSVGIPDGQTGLYVRLNDQPATLDLDSFLPGFDELLGDCEIQVLVDRFHHRAAHL
jgi:hypothetical protein